MEAILSRTISERLARLKRLRASLAKDVVARDQEIAALDAELRAAGSEPRKEGARPNAARMNEGTVGDAAAKVLPGQKADAPDPDRAGIERRGLYRTNSANLRSTVARPCGAIGGLSESGMGHRWIRQSQRR